MISAIKHSSFTQYGPFPNSIKHFINWFADWCTTNKNLKSLQWWWKRAKFTNLRRYYHVQTHGLVILRWKALFFLILTTVLFSCHFSHQRYIFGRQLQKLIVCGHVDAAHCLIRDVCESDLHGDLCIDASVHHELWSRDTNTKLSSIPTDIIYSSTGIPLWVRYGYCSM